MDQLCLFCRRPLVGVQDAEHIVPDAIGGWLKIHSVCGSAGESGCNHTLGHNVDRVVDSALLKTLRLEAGLLVPGGLPIGFVDDLIGDRIDLILDGSEDYRVRPRVYERDGKITIVASDAATLLKMARGFDKRVQRGGTAPIFGEPEPLGRGPVVAGFVADGEEGENAWELSRREAAKACIEYIALVAGNEVALRSEFDDLRTYALRGKGFINLDDVIKTGWAFGLGPDIWLPRMAMPLGIRESKDDVPSQADQLKSLLGPDGEILGPPAGRPHLTRIRHELRLWKGRGPGEFRLLLFGWLFVSVKLPDNLALPWDAMDARSFLPTRIESQRP
jgi:hypothetical protein